LIGNSKTGCDFCRDPDGDVGYPQYGVAPHECFWRKGPEFTLGQSTLLPVDQWEAGFVPDLEPHEDWRSFVYPSACGTYYCPHCDAKTYETRWNALIARIGPPPASITHLDQEQKG